MAYDEALADRVRDVLVGEDGLREQKMFGGLAFLVGGHMVCGVLDDDLVLRLGAAGADEALGKPHVRPMDFTGRPLKTMVYVGPDGLRGRALRPWVERALAHARTLPPKSTGAR